MTIVRCKFEPELYCPDQVIPVRPGEDLIDHAITGAQWVQDTVGDDDTVETYIMVSDDGKTVWNIYYMWLNNADHQIDTYTLEED